MSLARWNEARPPAPEEAEEPGIAAHGQDDGAHGEIHPHESPWLMWTPLVVLAGLAIVGGGLNLPFKHSTDACADRLAGPYDAFIRGANKDSAGEFVSCICPASVRDLPTVSKIGTTDQWIGELQRMLAAHLRYSINDLGIGSWGQYTKDTRAAVQRFQSDNRLKSTGTVDSRTWRALQHVGC